MAKADLQQENVEALKAGICNLEKHIENLQLFGVPVVVTLNAFVSDTQAELEWVQKVCEEKGCRFALANVWAEGGKGGEALAKEVLSVLKEEPSHFAPLYEDNLTIEEKIRKIATTIYGASDVIFEAKAMKELAKITELGLDHLPVCMAKNQYSFSDDAKALGRPEGFTTTIKEIRISAGAGFIVALTGNVMTMPGLPKKPAAEGIDINSQGVVTGLF